MAGRELVQEARDARLRRGRRRGGAAGRVLGRDHHARVPAAAHARGHRGQDVPADGDHDGLRALRRARLLGRVLPGAARHVRAAAEGARARAGSSRSSTPTRAALGCGAALQVGAARAAPASRSSSRSSSSRRPAPTSCRASTRATSWSRSAARRRSASPRRRSSTSRPSACSKRFPEVVTTLAMTGRAEVAIDPVGNDNTDIFVHLRPKKQWTTAHDLDDLSVAIKNAIESEVPGHLRLGVAADRGQDERAHQRLARRRADRDLRRRPRRAQAAQRGGRRASCAACAAPATCASSACSERPRICVRPDRVRLARYGVAAEDALSVVEAARVGMRGRLHLRGSAPLRSPARSCRRARPSPEALGELFVETAGGRHACRSPRSRRSRRPRGRRRCVARRSRAPCASR